MRLICAQFGVHVAGTRVPLELDLVRMPLRGLVLDSGDLGGIPGEPVRIEGRREGDPSRLGCEDHPVLAADAPPIALIVQDVGSRIFEIAVDEVVRQACVRVRDGLDGSVGLGLGGLGGVLLTALVRRNLAGGIRSVLVVGERICGQIRHVHADSDGAAPTVPMLVHLSERDLEPGGLLRSDHGGPLGILVRVVGRALRAAGQRHVGGAVTGVRLRIRLVRIAAADHAEFLQRLVGFDVGLLVHVVSLEDAAAHDLRVAECETEVLQHVHAGVGPVCGRRDVGERDGGCRILPAHPAAEREGGVARELVRGGQPAPLAAGEVLRGQRRVVGMRDGRVRVDVAAGHVDAHRRRFPAGVQRQVRPVDPAEFVRVWSGGAFAGLPAVEDRASARIVGRGGDGARRIGCRAGRVHRVGGAGQARAQRGRGDKTGDKSCKESHFPHPL